MQIATITKIQAPKPTPDYNKLLPSWQPYLIKGAGLANILLGAWWVMAPFTYFKLIGIGIPEIPQVWQIFGMLSVLYGLVYVKISRISADYWPVLAFGLLGKATTPIAFFYYGVAGNNWMWVIMLLSDLIWIPIFLSCLYQVGKAHQDLSAEVTAVPLPQALKTFRSQTGKSLWQLSHDSPVLVVFLRHFGCTFCKEALYEIAGKSPKIKEKGVAIVFAHMAGPAEAKSYFARYGLENHLQISDPTCQLYRAFSLERASFWQVFGPKTWWRGLEVMLTKKQGVGQLVGDGFQMPGVFLLHNGQIRDSFRHASASDTPDYLELAACPIA